MDDKDITTISIGDAPLCRATQGSAGYDLPLPKALHLKAGVMGVRVNLGVRATLPDGCFGMLVLRSSAAEAGLRLSNGVGIIDSDYRLDICVLLDNPTKRTVRFEAGRRIAQLVVVPCVMQGLAAGRRVGGFGSTDVCL